MDIQFSYAKAVTAEAVNAYKAKVAHCQESSLTVRAKVTTSWDG
jgi:hypothetical protein